MLLVAVAQYTAARSFPSRNDVGILLHPIPHVLTETSHLIPWCVGLLYPVSGGG